MRDIKIFDKEEGLLIDDKQLEQMGEAVRKAMDIFVKAIDDAGLNDPKSQKEHDVLLNFISNIITNVSGNLIVPIDARASNRVIFKSVYSVFNGFVKRKKEWKSNDKLDVSRNFADFASEFEIFVVNIMADVLPGSFRRNMLGSAAGIVAQTLLCEGGNIADLEPALEEVKTWAEKYVNYATGETMSAGNTRH